MVGLLKIGGKLTTERVKPCSHGRSFTTFHKTFLYLEHTSFQIYSSSNLLQSAEVETLQSSSCTKSGGDPTFLTKLYFVIERSVPEGSFVIDKAGTKHIVGVIRIAVAVHVENALPVDLQHALFKDMQIAYGTLMVGDLQGLLTVVEAPGKPLSADLRLLHSAKRSNNAN
jgi:hypothetical protein